MKNSKCINGIVCGTFVFPLAVYAQQQEVDCSIAENSQLEACTIDQVVITGSYLKRNKEDFSSPIESITAIEIQGAGNASLGQYVRDLTYTTNTDTVANTFAAQDGSQDSNSARFNLRGLGTDSTLTLYNGERVVNSGNVGGVVPDIALQQVDVVLDGGSSLYGSDAVAGVVNLISIKKFDGVKFRTYYNQGDGFEEPKFEFLGGKLFDNGLSVVASASWNKKTSLEISERPDYLAATTDTVTTASPGTWTASGRSQRDPSCGTFNGTNTDHSQPGSYPSGYPATIDIGPFTGVQRCAQESGQFGDVNRASEGYVASLNLNYVATDWLELNFEGSLTRRESKYATAPSAGGDPVTVPANHPNNPFTSFFGSPVSSVSNRWAPFVLAGTLPSFLERGRAPQPATYDTDRYSLRADYDFGSTSWKGWTTLSYQETNKEVDEYILSHSRMQSAIYGLGGPGCSFDNTQLIGLDTSAQLSALGAASGQADTGNCQRFNPFGTADSRAPGYNADPASGSITTNSQELVDWLYVREKYQDNAEELKYFQTVIAGDLFELPAGTVSSALGFQSREEYDADTGSRISARGDRFSDTDVRFDEIYKQTINAVFGEVAIPVTSRISIDSSIRYEDYKDTKLTTTAPKIGFRYEIFDDFAIRGSFAKNFVAPDGDEIDTKPPKNCSFITTSTDPIAGGGIIDGVSESCSAGNVNLKVQSSKIKNIGFGWAPTSDFSINLDYQEIEYTDKIVSLFSQDTLDQDEANFDSAVAAGLVMDSNGDTIIDAIDWANSSLAGPFVSRNPVDGSVVQVVRHPENVTGQELAVFDLRIQNGFATDNYGYFSQNLSVTSYKKFKYEEFDGEVGQAVGQQNTDSSLAPPIARYKASLNFGWLGDKQSASVIIQYLDRIKFDATTFFNTMPVDPSEAPVLLGERSRIPSFTTVDVRYSRSFNNLLGGEVSMGLGVNNLFERMPRPAPQIGGFETRLYDNFGRQYYIDLSYQPEF